MSEPGLPRTTTSVISRSHCGQLSKAAFPTREVFELLSFASLSLIAACRPFDTVNEFVAQSADGSRAGLRAYLVDRQCAGAVDWRKTDAQCRGLLFETAFLNREFFPGLQRDRADCGYIVPPSHRPNIPAGATRPSRGAAQSAVKTRSGLTTG